MANTLQPRMKVATTVIQTSFRHRIRIGLTRHSRASAGGRALRYKAEG